MTRADVKLGVEEVIIASWEPSKAELAEVKLHRKVLRAIASGDEPANELAEEALRTLGLHFKRSVA